MLWKTLYGLLALARLGSAINLTVSAKGGNVTSPLMYGLMFEDINHSGDGGVYAELIPNRAFQGSTEHPSTLNHWFPVGNAVLTLQNTSIPLSTALPTSVNVAAAPNSTRRGQIGIWSTGWWGMDVKPQKYTGSFRVLGSYKGSFTIKLQSNLTSQIFASINVPSAAQAGKWVEHSYTIQPWAAAPNSNNTFVLEFDSAGIGSWGLNLDLISLFPPTFNNRPNGNRADLMSAMKALNPSFLRMPGGNNMYTPTYFSTPVSKC
jgi:alpha-N-arabinofuranosidase